MARPKLDYSNMTIGSLLLGNRIEGGRHARFTYTCTTCGDTGERDARHIVRGCSHCKALAQIEGTDKRLTVATASESFVISPLQILMVLRKHPETAATPEPLRVRFYYEGKRVKVSEDMEYVHVSQAAIDGAPSRLSYPKIEQELDKCYSILLPEPAELAAAPDYASYFGDADLPDPFALHHEVPKLAEPVPDIPPPPPKEAYTPPDGWLKLERGSHAVWLGDEYPDEPLPAYLKEWFEKFPDCAYRVVHANGEQYAAASPVVVKKVQPLFDFDEDDEMETLRLKERADKAAKEAADKAALEATMLPERVAAIRAEEAHRALTTATGFAENMARNTNRAEDLNKYLEMKDQLRLLERDMKLAQYAANNAESADDRPKAKIIDINVKTQEQRMLDKLQSERPV